MGRVKRKLYGAGIAVGAFMMVTGTVLTVPADVAAQAQPAGDAAEAGETVQQAQPDGDTAQQAQPSPSPAAKPAGAPAQAPAAKPAATAAPAAKPTAKPAGTPATAPRAGGFPVELAVPLVAGGAAVAGAGVLMLRRGRRKG